MRLNGQSGTKGNTFGDVKAAGKALGAAMRDPELDPQTLALLVRDCGEAATTVKPGSSWNPTLGFKPFYSVKIAFPKGERRFSKGVYEAYETLANLAAAGFDGMEPNPNFGEAERDAKAVYAALDEAGVVKLTRYGALARPADDPKRVEGSATKRAPQSTAALL